MKNNKLSGPALFIYSAIALTAIASAVIFSIYYTGTFENEAFLWSGVVCFIVLYQFGLRILFGEISKRMNINYAHPFYRERGFEKYLYKLLFVRRWKDKVLTFDPDAYNFKNRTLPELARTMSKSELDHWVNVLISIGGMFFALVWGCPEAFIITAVLAILFDAQFIVVQRYNRPIVVRLIERKKQRGEI